MSRKGRTAYSLPALDVPREDDAKLLPAGMTRAEGPDLPEVSEIDVVRHFVRMSRIQHGVDVDFYPLGSCTMKYNPKINERVVALPGFNDVHPYGPDELVQGCLKLLYDMEKYLAEISGFDRVTLQPAAGAHGEFTGIQIIRAYHEAKGHKKTKVIVPDSAHGTNPATSAMVGYEIVQVHSNERGGVDLESLKSVLDDQVAALMLTNPNTLGLFDENIHVIADLVHKAGGLLYYDGANTNAIMGYARPGDAGFDVCHLNLHKTFATPHGGGGPGSGPVGVKKELVPFLPTPTVEFDGQKYSLDYNHPQSIGKTKTFYGNFGVIVKAYTYIRAMGPDGLKAASQDAVLNANYIMANIKKYYWMKYDRICKHEFVASGKWQKEKNGVKTLDIAKRLLDYGVHPPTVYFPQIVDEALMIEPTETESKETLDRFIETLKEIAAEADKDPEKVKTAPHTTPVGRLDETKAARQPILRWKKA
ncbi:MAG TPA: aminomethyl-transferring glycine dehydrogenase subunit GcvPB [Bacillota bacterium]|jgi:glycine dehydrogenase subunit 2